MDPADLQPKTEQEQLEFFQEFCRAGAGARPGSKIIP
ncbi:MAG: hypothetical protein QOG67_3632 [Verrucomicrobiota bacterium]